VGITTWKVPILADLGLGRTRSSFIVGLARRNCLASPSRGILDTWPN